jgi:cyclopropane fatty-acyl-phospholipid synthase-like methyltransferase
MDRSDWLQEQRREAEEKYDTLWAPLYDEKWGLYSNRSHQQFIRKFLKLLPKHSTILDAACGAGRYMPMLLKKGHTVIGIDQSQGMLTRAQAKFPTVHVAKIGLQEMSYNAVFDGAICMDAMEHVFPEDWPPVLGNFQQALKPQGYLYFTVEIADESEVEEAFIRGQQAGLPVVYGEWIDREVYHYYPPLEKVREWIQQARFDLTEEGEGDGYHHFLVRKAALEPIELPKTEEVNVAQPFAAAVSG